MFSSGRRRRRQVSTVLLNVEIRDEPRNSLTSSSGIQGEVLSNIASRIINNYQSGELTTAWQNLNITGNVIPINMSVQEPYSQSWVSLSIINRTRLVVPPAQCRQQSPCTIQPVLVAYDANGTVIQKLGSRDRPWQVKATVLNPPNATIIGDIANYSDGQTQFTIFGLPNMRSYQIQFTFLQPDGVTRYSTEFFTILIEIYFSSSSAIVHLFKPLI